MRVAFGAFVLDTATRELSRDGRPLALTPKAFDILAMLVANRPRVVSKADLQERLWPDRFVVDKNLANLVSEIRDALGENASNPHFIRTAHRVGYAFRDPTGKSADGDRSNRHPALAVRLIGRDQRIALQDGEHVLGRDPDADVYLDSPSVSRRHAVIRVAEGEATLEDVGSRNGTFVEKRRIESVTALKDGDSIRLGSVELTFRAVVMRGSTQSEASKY
jgi:DNA-binding winged helix-turn-helix (wHTH) protein